MHTRSPELTAFMNTLSTAIIERAESSSDELRVINTIMQAFGVAQASAPTTTPSPAWLPVCSFLDKAVDNVVESASVLCRDCNASLANHAKALQALSPQLSWWQRPDAQQWGKPFANGHANATVIGQGGLATCDDVWVGISLMAPSIEYPEHRHPPEEVYLVLSQGHWLRVGEAWHEPGVGGLVYNPPGILHAMRSGAHPLLATWCLWKQP